MPRITPMKGDLVRLECLTDGRTQVGTITRVWAAPGNEWCEVAFATSLQEFLVSRMVWNGDFGRWNVLTR